MAQIRPALHEYRTWTLDSRRWNGYAPRPDDIIIATAPKCGTTWTQQIVSSLVFQDAAPRGLGEVSTWVEARMRGTEADMLSAIAGQRHRRFLKTHLPADGIPLYDEVKYIHVARDGRDALMSMHNHFTGFSDGQLAVFDRIGSEDPVVGGPYPRLPSDPAEFFRLWISTPVVAGQNDGFPAPSFFELEAGWWSLRARENVLLVHYADLRADLDAEMRRVAAFLDIAVDEATWPSLVGAAGFEAMRGAADTLMPQMSRMLTDGSKRFFNKGTNGRWRDVLTDADLALFEAKVAEKLSPALAAWLEGGRLQAGDPRTSVGAV